MRKQVTYVYCDFRGMVKPHVGEFSIETDKANTNLPGDPHRFDACEKHLGKMVADLWAKGARKVTIDKLSENVNGNASRKNLADTMPEHAPHHDDFAYSPRGGGATYGHYVCEELTDGERCGREFDTAQGLGAHRFQTHGIRKATA